MGRSGWPAGASRKRLGQARLGTLDIQRERSLAGERQIADRVRLQLVRLLGLAGGAHELERLQVVVGEHVGEVVGALARPTLEPGGGCAVASGASGAGDLGVADVSDQQVPEAVLALVLHRGGGRATHELLARELVQRLLDVARVSLAHLGQGTAPEHLADHGGVLEQALALLREGVQPGGNQRLDRVRHLLDHLPAVGQQAHELLREKGVASRPLQQRPLRLRRQHRALEQRGDQPRGLLVGQRGEVDGRRVAQPGRPGRMLLLQLRTRRTEHEQRHALRPIGEMLEERQQGIIGPVQVLEHEHRRAL